MAQWIHHNYLITKLTPLIFLILDLKDANNLHF